ncbi:MAG: GH3 auxin-responsive promoter family protein [Myxococcota bacterium]|nr:GH3 auxin-responsive promoter family protein [Myxococcota bacterium]
MIRPLCVHGAWLFASWPHARRLRRALRDPGANQTRLLERTLAGNARSAFGRHHGFAEIASVRDYQRRVPIRTYEDYDDWLARVRGGEQRVLCEQPVERFVPSSGSTRAAKLVPYTPALRAEFARALGAWIVDLYGRRPELLRGRSYWCITPPVPFHDEEASSVPIGFSDDSEYVGGRFGRLVASTFAVHPRVQEVRAIDAFRYVTALELLRARDLALVSVWHPSFLTLLFDDLREHWESLVRDVRSGDVHAPVEIEPTLAETFRSRPRPRRADELRGLGPGRWPEVWPRLRLVSAWGDGHARGPFESLQAALPGVELQAKGLLATEMFATVPFAGGFPPALESHFFEFLDAQQRPRLVSELADGEEYSLVVTTGGGLYRYRTHDRVRVEGRVYGTPSLRFVGKEDCISDRCGEKLSEGFVAGCIARALDAEREAPRFAMLAPEGPAGGSAYTLYVESAFAPSRALASRLERELRENPHYRTCRELGQLGPLRVYRVQADAHALFIDWKRVQGRRLGDIKPTALSADDGWSSRFAGSYLEASAEGEPGGRAA